MASMTYLERGKSVNAVRAEESGLMVGSKLSKRAGVEPNEWEALLCECPDEI